MHRSGAYTPRAEQSRCAAPRAVPAGGRRADGGGRGAGAGHGAGPAGGAGSPAGRWQLAGSSCISAALRMGAGRPCKLQSSLRSLAMHQDSRRGPCSPSGPMTPLAGRARRSSTRAGCCMAALAHTQPCPAPPCATCTHPPCRRPFWRWPAPPTWPRTWRRWRPPPRAPPSTAPLRGRTTWPTSPPRVGGWLWEKRFSGSADGRMGGRASVWASGLSSLCALLIAVGGIGGGRGGSGGFW